MVTVVCTYFYNVCFFLVLSGATFKRLWVGQVENDSNIIPLAILYGETSVCIFLNDTKCLTCFPKPKKFFVENHLSQNLRV